jgi:hypothetical protein
MHGLRELTGLSPVSLEDKNGLAEREMRQVEEVTGSDAEDIMEHPRVVGDEEDIAWADDEPDEDVRGLNNEERVGHNVEPLHMGIRDRLFILVLARVLHCSSTPLILSLSLVLGVISSHCASCDVKNSPTL